MTLDTLPQLALAYWPFLLGGLLVLLALVLLLRRGGQHVEIGTVDPVLAPTLVRKVAEPSLPSPPISNVVAEPLLAGDDLQRIKGLGPKVAERLSALGITRYDQLATLDDPARAALDAQLGTFAGRMARDRWVEQAQLLASGDTEAFEAQFGRLG